MKNNIIIIGLGNIGRRHFQGVSPLASVAQITGYDKSPDELAKLRQFCRDNHINDARIELAPDWSAVLRGITHESIVILATTADSRCSLIKEIMDKRPMAIIAEKPLCQNQQDYNGIAALSRSTGVAVYVNFIRHSYPLYRKIKTELRGQRVGNFHAVTWGGVACAGVHAIELMTWLLSANSYEMIYANTQDIFDTKRKGFKDIAGEMIVKFDTGTIGSLYVTQERGMEAYEITSNQLHYKIYEPLGKVIVLDKDEKIREERIEATPVSLTSGGVVEDLISKKRTDKLPDIREAHLAHKILFEYLQGSQLEQLNFT